MTACFIVLEVIKAREREVIACYKMISKRIQYRIIRTNLWATSALDSSSNFPMDYTEHHDGRNDDDIHDYSNTLD